MDPAPAPHARETGPPRGAPAVLLVGLLACVLHAAFAGGGSGPPQETLVQLVLLALAGFACAAWLYGNGVAFAGSRLAWTGVALLGGFAVWSAASVAWSVAPDRSWEEANRALAAALVVLLGVAVGSSLPRAGPRAAAGLALVVGAVALFALGGKTLPGLTLGGLVDLDHAGELTRLRAPLGYWNALGLVCVLGALPCLAVALDNGRRAGGRIVAVCALSVLLVVLGLTYSRGGLLALGVGLVVLVAAGAERLRPLAWAGAAGAACAAPLAVALSSADLTTDDLPFGRREDDAFLVFMVVVAALAALAILGRGVIWLETRGAFTPARDRLATRALGAAILVGLAVAVGAVAASDRGVGGTISDAADRFTRTRADPTTDPRRVLSTTSGNRWLWWREAAGAWSDRPVEGWGAGSFPLTHRLYRTIPFEVQQPHSMPIQWLAETGIVGMALALGGLLALLAAALARARSLRPGPARTATAALAAAGAAWLVHSLFDWDWSLPGATLPALLALGVAVARPAAPAARPPGARGGALAVAVTVLLALGVAAALPALSASRTAAALDAAAAGSADPDRLAAAAADAELAARLNPFAVAPLFATASIAERLGDTQEARRQLLRAVRRQPESSDAWARLVRIELTLRDGAAMRRAADRLLALDPAGPVAISLAGRVQAALTPPEGSPTATGSPLPAAPSPEPSPEPTTEPEPESSTEPEPEPEPSTEPEPSREPSPQPQPQPQPEPEPQPEQEQEQRRQPAPAP